MLTLTLGVFIEMLGLLKCVAAAAATSTRAEELYIFSPNLLFVKTKITCLELVCKIMSENKIYHETSLFILSVGGKAG